MYCNKQTISGGDIRQRCKCNVQSKKTQYTKCTVGMAAA